ncbi:unnamed protein product [Didymodactylos carnosus]|uniref:SCP domain-containing protein n=1 Tax=Didymodactylos carnosus TaxID=1234261 RepID=A0A815X7C8_9BILA|nr:unnamed protein product [Didymodactylos carnosus]CAF1552931.1 unnamed protein product [Didymodactylos carnosus]CAF3573571.1 unnamed protein product [Didymodactylos carnosus]CAF4414029.1 unnamed protein product [Didymodactylos carnosus]
MGLQTLSGPVDEMLDEETQDLLKKATIYHIPEQWRTNFFGETQPTTLNSRLMSISNKQKDYLTNQLVWLDYVNVCIIISQQLPAAQKASRSSSASTQTAVQKNALRQHNIFRRRHCVSALKLNNTLNSIAQRYANKLANTNTFVHSNNKLNGQRLGENLWQTTSSRRLTAVDGTKATADWYNEIDLYDFRKPGFSSATGHFTQLVWSATKSLGIGIAYTKDGKTAFVVANYYPAGNVAGSSYFERNVPKQKQKC